jgi:hypothetical protein
MDPAAWWESRTTRIAFLGLALTAMTLRVFKATVAPLTYDEAYSYLRFARLPVLGIFTDYHAPNNHLLHTLAMKLVSVVGIEGLLLRLPSLVGSLLFVGALLLILPRLFGVGQALGLYAILVFHPMLVDFGSLARGYSQGLGFTMVAIALLVGRPGETPRGHFLAASVASFLAVASVPVFVNPIAALFIAVAVVAVWKRHWTQLRRALTWLWIPAPLLTVFWYSGILGSAEPSSWKWGHRGFWDAATSLWSRGLALNLPTSVAIALSGVVLLLVTASLVRRRWSEGAILLAVASALIPCFLALEHHVFGILYPFARSLIYVVPLIFVTVAYALSGAWSGPRAAAWSVVSVVACAWFLAQYSPTYTHPWEHNVPVKRALEVLSEDPEPRICYSWVNNVVFEYYRERGLKSVHDCDVRTAEYVLLSEAAPRVPGAIRGLPSKPIFVDGRGNMKLLEVNRVPQRSFR